MTDDLSGESPLENIARRIWRKCALTAMGFAALTMAVACTEKYEDFERHPVDQVFVDHDGYRTYWTDENSLIREEKFDKYYSNGRLDLPPEGTPEDIARKFIKLDQDEAHPAYVFKDLNPSERGYVNILRFDYGGGIFHYAEIHLPRDRGLSPGNETWGGKHETNSPMGEIR